MGIGRIALTALGTGVAGWLLENILEQCVAPAGQPPPARYSMHCRGIPFMPVYAVGGAAIAALAPHLSNVHPIGRAITYGATLTAVESIAGHLERARGRMSWDYGGSPIDLPHAIAWTALGYGLERVLDGRGRRSRGCAA